MKTWFTLLTVLTLTWITVAAPADPDPAMKKDDPAKVEEPKKVDEPKKDEPLPAPKAAPEPT